MIIQKIQKLKFDLSERNKKQNYLFRMQIKFRKNYCNFPILYFFAKILSFVADCMKLLRTCFVLFR